MVELSKRTDCFISNNILKLRLQKGANPMMSYNDAININGDVYIPFSDMEFQNLKDETDNNVINIKTFRRLLSTVSALKKKQI